MAEQERRPIVALVKQEIVGGDWRHSLYRRQDGSEFHVTIPPLGLVDPMSKAHAGYAYDERAEADMMLRLADPPVPVSPSVDPEEES